jgi:flagellar hook-length control protein FliK
MKKEAGRMLIDVSPQIEAHPEVSGTPEGSSKMEGSAGEGIFRTKKGRKKDGLGIFSKLLAGLHKKKEPAAASGSKKPEETLTVFNLDARTPRTLVQTLSGGEPGTRLRGGASGVRQADSGPAPQGEEGVFPLTRKQKAGKTLQNALEGEQKGENPLKAETEDKKAVPVHQNELFQNQESVFEAPKEPEKLQKPDREGRKITVKDLETETPAAENRVHEGIGLQIQRDDKKTTETRNGDKTRDRRKERTVVEVRDLRTGTGAEAAASLGLKAVEEARGSEGDLVVELRPLSSESGSRDGSGTILPETGQGTESFENILARELNGELSSDIVRQAIIVLKDGGQGTIRLSLRPETLGSVKIRLEMADNKIAGHIIVESDEALKAFEREIHTLEQAFEESGFEQAKMELALDSRSRQDQQWKGDEARPFFSERFAASHYELSGLEAEASGYAPALGFSAVNMLA